MPANSLFQHLIQNNIVGSQGSTNFNLNNVSLTMKDKSSVGNLIQEWLGEYMRINAIHYRVKPNTQEFPDYLLDKNNSNINNLLEIKAFTKSPNFDIANFKSYARSLRGHAYRLDAKYLIFKYSLSNNIITIDNIWLKNVWEICSNSERSDIKIQWKESSPVNIRPATWYSKRAKYKPFNSRLDFVIALNKVIGTAGVDQSIQKDWLKVVKDNYKTTTGNNL